MTERLQEFNVDGEVQHVELTSLLSEAKDKEKKQVAELSKEFNGDGEVQHEVLTNLLSEAKDNQFNGSPVPFGQASKRHPMDGKPRPT